MRLNFCIELGEWWFDWASNSGLNLTSMSRPQTCPQSWICFWRILARKLVVLDTVNEPNTWIFLRGRSSILFSKFLNQTSFQSLRWLRKKNSFWSGTLVYSWTPGDQFEVCLYFWKASNCKSNQQLAPTLEWSSVKQRVYFLPADAELPSFYKHHSWHNARTSHLRLEPCSTLKSHKSCKAFRWWKLQCESCWAGCKVSNFLWI
jgi:hypothetical protein